MTPLCSASPSAVITKHTDKHKQRSGAGSAGALCKHLPTTSSHSQPGRMESRARVICCLTNCKQLPRIALVLSEDLSRPSNTANDLSCACQMMSLGDLSLFIVILFDVVLQLPIVFFLSTSLILALAFCMHYRPTPRLPHLARHTLLFSVPKDHIAKRGSPQSNDI